MFGTALYYPYIDIPDGGWLRSAVLFWDHVQTIVPSSIRNPYRSADTHVCEQEEYLQPLPCDLHRDVLEELGRRVLKLLQYPEWNWRRFSPDFVDPSQGALRASNQRLEELHGIHPGKVMPGLREELIQNTGFRLIDSPYIIRDLAEYGVDLTEMEEWLVVDGPFAAVYMSALAALLAKQVQVSPLTNEEPSSGINLRCLIDDVVEGGETAARGALVSVVMKGLKVDPEVPMKKLLAFRRHRIDQLAELTGIFDDLKAKIEKSSSTKELEESARKLYTGKIKPELQKLKRELKLQAIQSVWEGLQRGITISAPAGGVLAATTGFSGTILLGAAAFITLADVGMKSFFARSKARASPYTYLLDVERKFSLPHSKRVTAER
jgi:hypothetical protein